MTTHHADPNHQPGTTTPPQTARAAFSPPRLHPWIRCPPRPCSTLEALQRPQTPQPLGMAVAVVCCSAHGDPVLAVAIAHLATAAAPVPATAPAADLNPPANPPAGPPAPPGRRLRSRAGFVARRGGGVRAFHGRDRPRSRTGLDEKSDSRFSLMQPLATSGQPRQPTHPEPHAQAGRSAAACPPREQPFPQLRSDNDPPAHQSVAPYSAPSSAEWAGGCADLWLRRTRHQPAPHPQVPQAQPWSPPAEPPVPHRWLHHAVRHIDAGRRAPASAVSVAR